MEHSHLCKIEDYIFEKNRSIVYDYKSTLYKGYKENPKKALDNYKYALSLGGTKTLPELYKAAGINFDFSHKNISELMIFVKNELDLLK